MSIVDCRIARATYQYRHGRDGQADSYRRARWHLKCAREWASALRFLPYKTGTKKRYAHITNCLLDHLLSAAYHREQARWFKRMRALGAKV